MELSRNNYIICSSCQLSFEKTSARHCSNCFACTGCEIYYCPRCDMEIIIKPIKRMETLRNPSTIGINKKRRKKK